MKAWCNCLRKWLYDMLNMLCRARRICLLVFGNIHLLCSALTCIYIGSSVLICLCSDSFRWEQSIYSCDMHYRLFIIINSLNVTVPPCRQICVPQFSWCAYRVSGVLFFLDNHKLTGCLLVLVKNLKYLTLGCTVLCFHAIVLI